MRDFDLDVFWDAGLLVHAFLAGGDPHCLELLWASLNFDESVLQGAKVSLSSSSTHTIRSTMGSAVSGSSRDDLGGTLDMGELVAPRVPNPFGGAGTSMGKGFLKKV